MSNGMLGMGGSKNSGKLLEGQTPSTRFADVKGEDAALQEVEEIKDFLQDPSKYNALGARIPRGVLLYGPPGTGKTHLSISIGIKALQQGYKVIFTTVSDMMSALFESKADNSYAQKLKYYLSSDLLILDELGFRKLNEHIVDQFYEIISQRYEKGSLIITSNKTFDEWGNIFWDSILASAILDRIVHHCHLVLIKGESYRMREQKENLKKSM